MTEPTTAAGPDEAYRKGWTAGYYQGQRDARQQDASALDEDDERTYTEDEYIEYGVRQYERAWAQAEYEAAHPVEREADPPAEPKR